MGVEAIEAAIRDVRDFPKPGIVFKDITPILAQPALLQEVAELMAANHAGEEIDRVVGIDARGFIFGATLAYRLNKGLAIVRKKGKLPWETVGAAYELEYGTAEVEMHRDAVQPGERVLVVDDLLATGGTATAACNLVEQLGAKVVACEFVIELSFLDGRQKLAPHPVNSLVQVLSE